MPAARHEGDDRDECQHNYAIAAVLGPFPSWRPRRPSWRPHRPLISAAFLAASAALLAASTALILAASAALLAASTAPYPGGLGGFPDGIGGAPGGLDGFSGGLDGPSSGFLDGFPGDLGGATAHGNHPFPQASARIMPRESRRRQDAGRPFLPTLRTERLVQRVARVLRRAAWHQGAAPLA